VGCWGWQKLIGVFCGRGSLSLFVLSPFAAPQKVYDFQLFHSFILGRGLDLSYSVWAWFECLCISDGCWFSYRLLIVCLNRLSRICVKIFVLFDCYWMKWFESWPVEAWIFSFVLALLVIMRLLAASFCLQVLAWWNDPSFMCFHSVYYYWCCFPVT